MACHLWKAVSNKKFPYKEGNNPVGVQSLDYRMPVSDYYKSLKYFLSTLITFNNNTTKVFGWMMVEWCGIL